MTTLKTCPVRHQIRYCTYTSTHHTHIHSKREMQYQIKLKLTQGEKLHLTFQRPLLKQRIRKIQNTQMNKKKYIIQTTYGACFSETFIPASTHCISHICLHRLSFLSLQMCLSTSTRENRASICKCISPAYKHAHQPTQNQQLHLIPACICRPAAL